MSINATKWVWESSKAVGNMKLVLLLIADCANHEGTHAFPSIGFIAERVGIGERGVQSCIAKLVALGDLLVNYRKGPNGTNLFTIPLNKLVAFEVNNGAPQANAGTGGDEQPFTFEVNPDAPKPSLNHQVTEEAAPRKKFIKPTVGDIYNLIQLIHVEKKQTISFNAQEEAQDIWEFYENKGWKIGSVAMKDWTLAVRRWIRGKMNGGFGSQQQRGLPSGPVMSSPSHKPAPLLERAGVVSAASSPEMRELFAQRRTSEP